VRLVAGAGGKEQRFGGPCVRIVAEGQRSQILDLQEWAASAVQHAAVFVRALPSVSAAS